MPYGMFKIGEEIHWGVVIEQVGNRLTIEDATNYRVHHTVKASEFIKTQIIGSRA